MRIVQINKLLLIFLGGLVMTSCGASQQLLNQVEDDVYFSRKTSKSNPVYVPEVDVNELIKHNPPQYNNGTPPQELTPETPYTNGDNTNPNAAAGYAAYLRNRDQAPIANNEHPASINYAQDTQLPQVSYLDNSMLYTNYNGWGNFPTSNVSFWPGNTYYGGWGLGFSYGRNRWWRNRARLGYWGTWGFPSPMLGFGATCYTPYNPWAFNSFYYDPFYASFYQPFYNPWYYQGHAFGRPFYGGWNTPDRVVSPRINAPRGQVGSSLPRSGMERQNPPSGNTVQQPITPSEQPARVALPRTNQSQLIQKDGQQIYVAPEQYRQAAPRTYNSYTPSVQQGRTYQQVVPPVQNQRPAQAQQTPPQQRPVFVNPPQAPSQPAPAPRTYQAPPSRGSVPSFGGGRSSGGSNGGGGSSGGRVSMPRPR